LQPLDENGRARPVLPGGYYDVAFPIRDAGTAWGTTFKAKELMTVEDAARATAMMLEGDMIWMRDQLLAALFTNTTYTHADEQFGNLTIQPLAITSDGVTYQRRGSLAAATDEHFLFLNDTIDDSADVFPTIVDELKEHPENSGEVIVLLSSSLVASVKALTSFHQAADPNITYGNASDRLTGSFGGQVPGTLLGYHDAGAWIAEWPSIPSGYLIAVMTQGPRPLAMRQYDASSLQGFIEVPDQRIDHPFYERQYVRYAGFGAYNRVGAVVMEINDSAYGIPSGMTAPIP
jgi:hypothetical protein